MWSTKVGAEQNLFVKQILIFISLIFLIKLLMLTLYMKCAKTLPCPEPCEIGNILLHVSNEHVGLAKISYIGPQLQFPNNVQSLLLLDKRLHNHLLEIILETKYTMK